MMEKPEHVWIIGASSGIGRALAVAYAKRGAKLILSARREAELTGLNQELGGSHAVVPLDVAEEASFEQAMLQVGALGRIDRVIFLAAIYTPLSIQEIGAEDIDRIIDVNLKGAFRTVRHVLPLLLGQGGGQFALCGSVAGYCGLPNAQPYSATKAAIINLAETLRVEQGDVIDVRLISPGFVETPMTAKNAFEMPMIVSVETAAGDIIKGLDGKGFEVHFPKRFTRLMKLLRLLPYCCYFWIAKRFIP